MPDSQNTQFAQLSSQLKQQLAAKWQTLEQRERLTLMIGSIFVLIIIVYSFIWAPMQQSIHKHHDLLPAKRADLVWMQQQAENYKSNKQITKVSDKPLLTIIEETAQQAGLREQIQQMSPGDNPNEVKVSLSETSFDDWIKWVDSLNKQYGVSVTAASIQREEEKRVDIRVSFGR